MSETRNLQHIAPDLRGSVVALTRLRLDEANAREHPPRSIEAIKASLERFGQQKPVVLGKGNVVRAGNGTVLAARELGWTHVAVSRSNLRGPELEAYAIADNRTAEFAEWNRERLAAILAELPEDALAATGWTPPDLDALLRPEDPEPTEDVAPSPLEQAVTRTGDLWLLGEHRLLCGDSTQPESYQRLMRPRERARLCATDPPYLVDYTGVRAGHRGKDWSDTYREIDIKDARGFFHAVFSRVLEVLAPHAAIYCWHAHKRHPIISDVWSELDILDHQQIVWVKPAALFGSVFWHFRHEACVMGWKRTLKPTHDGRHDYNSVWELGTGGLEDLTREQLLQLVQDHSSVWYIDWAGKARPTANEHPTEKPVEIFARPMRKHTKRGDVVLEPFSGSGSQLSAAEQLGRRCRAIEISPAFVDVGVRRWQRLTGKDATLEGDGRTWSEVASERGVTTDGG